MKNNIKTAEQYMAEGFTAKEVPMIRRHDELFNKWVDNEITEIESAELDNLRNELGL